MATGAAFWNDACLTVEVISDPALVCLRVLELRYTQAILHPATQPHTHNGQGGRLHVLQVAS